MKTTIKINGLDVEFSDTPPTRPGAYWYTVAEMAPQLMHVQCGEQGTLYVPGEGMLDGFHGLWSAPLVPVTEVEECWNEAWMAGSAGMDASYDERQDMARHDYKNSRARRVVEGVE